jgi:hypothetical protein
MIPGQETKLDWAHNLLTTVYKLGMHAKGVFGIEPKL